MSIAAIILAAGMSLRMGRPKMVLPWGDTTVIGRVVQVMAEGGAEEIVVVTGGARQEVEAALAGLPARCVFNPRYQEDEMAISLQAGLEALSSEVEAALVALGDQPQVDAGVARQVIATFRASGAPLVVPSYSRRRGHPWLLARSLWPSALALRARQTLRDLLNAHADQITYLEVDQPSILRDLDTPEDYDHERPG